MRLSILVEASNILYQNEFGYVKGYVDKDGYTFIDKLYIYPEYRGQGKAKELMKHIPRKARLLAQPMNTKDDPSIPRDNLISFYKSLGFTEHPDSNGNMIMIREDVSEDQDIEAINKEYPLAGPIVDGLHVMDKIDNIGSIRSTFDNYHILKGVRKVSTEGWQLPPIVSNRVKALAQEIEETKTIMPLIVAIGHDGNPYILEGSHRIDAILLLKKKFFPALIVIDRDGMNLNEHLKQVNGKWALVSKTTGRVLRYYKGSGKPSQEWVSKMERQIHAFENYNKETVKLEDLYDWHELNDESETLYHWIDDNDLKNVFEVQTMMPAQAKHLETAKNDMTVYDAFKKFATKDQKALIKNKSKNYDPNRIIVLSGNTVIDGNHHVIASILNNKPLKYIDLSEPLDHLNEENREPLPIFITDNGQKIHYISNRWYSAEHPDSYKNAIYIPEKYTTSFKNIDKMVEHFGLKHLRANIHNGYLSFEHDLNNGRWIPVRIMFEGQSHIFQIPCDIKWSPSYSALFLYSNDPNYFKYATVGKVKPFVPNNINNR